MKLFDTILGRTKPVQANLDNLFALPGAAITLETAAGYKPTGRAGVCFKPPAGQSFADIRQEIEQILKMPDPDSRNSALLKDTTDSYGYQWIVVTNDDFDALVTQVHVVNSSLAENGYGPQLLCSVFGFASTTGSAGPMYLVYLFKQGSFYPFAPLPNERRDNEAELRLKGVCSSDLRIESDLSRWFPIWDLPL